MLIAVPGLGGNYDNVSLVFPKGSYPTLSLSPPGGLCSDCLPDGTPHTIAKCTEALEKLLEHYAPLLDEFGRDHVVIVGASFGGFVVADYFAKHPTSEISAVILAGQDTPLDPGAADIAEWYLQLVSLLFPLADNVHLQQYVASARVFDVSNELVNTRNRWLIIAEAEDDILTGTKAMAERLGERARYAEIPGNHFALLVNAEAIRQVLMDNLDFLVP